LAQHGQSRQKKLREILPHTQFLIPGFGAQGGSAEGALAGFSSKGNHLENGIINSSRGILYPESANEAKNIDEWRKIILDNLESANSELKHASENVIQS